MNPSNPYKAFANSVALVLAEIVFWLLLLAVWVSVQRVAPNITMERL